ncbi:uncharacterized protein PHACADRAFT_168658 [Phanerochaete carnosa HHB-10118-sp]|uniref:Glycosyltransferase family 32 protein n=1 Tax=Phanerochaete carnosa (strain HHB-10118-sp) TaxID=650164 RepID=K5WP43_PHACS|nr:uncharacterized protein PHACADRAFT_168658 [Phanerochaete carnosa HHB-10118-sp]EKM61230.1 hypothetical protein PHACADRAFT_168658 [Phanerochaete carnosa HHB-10118-sp]
MPRAAYHGWFSGILGLLGGPPDRRRRDSHASTRAHNIPLRIIALARRRPYCFAVALLIGAYTLLALYLRYVTVEKIWIPPFTVLGPPTLAFDVRDLKSIWQWEVAAGHYPSAHSVPSYIGSDVLRNPARPTRNSDYASTAGVGPPWIYVTPNLSHANIAYPSRPVPGSAADLDIVVRHCDFSVGKYVRDCLKLLRNGAELDVASRRVRGGASEQFRYIYVTDSAKSGGHSREAQNETTQVHDRESHYNGRRAGLSKSRLTLPPLPTISTHDPCHSVDRRIFHMFWTGPFTDKPYMALLSFLYTQNLGLHVPPEHSLPTCRTEMWVWITQPDWARYKRATWEKRMHNELKTNPWASVFLHPRFSQVIQFKVWDAVEQLDATDELKDEWRRYMHMVFKSKLPRDRETVETPEDVVGDGEDDIGLPDSGTALVNRSPQSADAYDKPSVALSDLVRFVLCHRFGGVYLDVDTLLLRDWEELWGAPGAFAYRWSRLERYNTAVLRMHRQSALGTWLLRTALQSGLDFHPIRVSRYLEDAQMEGLLQRLPDALFDPAWLMVEGFHTERPPQPLLNTFDDFFKTPPRLGASPEALGFDGFYKGAFSYHYHNRWWTPFDPDRNYPDVGPRFGSDQSPSTEHPPEAVHELSWSAVIKRTFEAYIRGEQPNMYGERLYW